LLRKKQGTKVGNSKKVCTAQNTAGKRPATFFFKINQSTLESRYKMLWDCQLENDVLPDPGPGTVLLFKESPDPLFKFWVERSYLTLDFRRTV